MKRMEVKKQNHYDKDKIVLIALVAILLVIVVLFLNSSKFKLSSEKDEDNNFIIPHDEVQIELALVLKHIGNETVDESFRGKIYHLQLAFVVDDMNDCFMGLKKTRELYEAGFKTEALFEYATVMHCCLNKKIKPYTNGKYNPTFEKSINIAHNNGIINCKQKQFLHSLRKLRNKKAHKPGINFDKEITELYLSTGINLLEKAIIDHQTNNYI